MAYDVVILGAGVAGIACAITLKEFGVSCIVLNAEAETKACGGGITDKALDLLKLLGIDPIEFIEKGAKVIKRSKQIYKNGKIRITDYTSRHSIGYSLGISRERFDSILHDKAVDKGVEILEIEKNCCVKKDDYLSVNGITCKYLVYAIGATSNKKIILKKNIKRTFGLSMEVNAELDIKDDAFYFFMENNETFGDYGWIFPIGTNRWSVGVWRRDASFLTKDYFDSFYKKVFQPKINLLYSKGKLKGGYINCGENKFYKSDKEYYIGDCGGCSNITNGEGIFQALKSGIEAAKDIVTCINYTL